MNQDFKDNRSDLERNGVPGAYRISIPTLNAESIALNVMAFNDITVLEFTRAALEGSLYGYINTLEIDGDMIEKLDWTVNESADKCPIRLNGSGMASPLLFGSPTYGADRIVQYRAAVGYAMQSLKEISECAYGGEDGSAFLCADRGETIMNRANMRAEMMPRVSSPLSSASTSDLPGEIELLRHHPALSALKDITSVWRLDENKGVIIDAEHIGTLTRVHQVESMTTTDLLAESVKSMLTTYQLERFGSFSYDEAAIEVLGLADEGEISTEVVTAVSSALLKASIYFDATVEHEMNQDALLDGLSNNRNNSEPSF